MADQTVDRHVKALMTLLDPEHGLKGLSIAATPAVVEALKASDSPFAGYVISCIVPPDQSKAEYDDWVKKTVNRTF